MEKKTHHIIQFIGLLTVLTVILLQGLTKVVPSKPLNAFEQKENEPVDLSFQTYYDGSYQQYLTNYAKQNTGFREFFIRNYNQFVYSCLHSVTNQHIKKGRNRELYLKMYLDEVTGKTLRDTYSDINSAMAVAQRNVDETLRLVDSLHNHGTQFLFVFAPTKTKVYPENMPRYYRKHISDFSLEEYYIDLFEEKGIPHIDFLSYFEAIKDTITFPLYTRTGTHWAASTLPFVTDSIMKKIADLTGKDLPNIRCIEAPPTTEYREQDGELEGKMNLLFPLNKPALPSPLTALSDTMGKAHLNLLVVGDSHFGTLLETCFTDAFANWNFWEYNKTVISSNPDYSYVSLNDYYDAYKVLKETDIVMAVFTAPMLYDYMFGFTDTAFNLYETLQCDSCIREIQIEKYKWIIRKDAGWYDAVVKQAEERGIDVEQALRNNAEYMIFMETQRDPHEE